MDKPVKPEKEYFFNVLYTAYCGECKRMIFTGGGSPLKHEKCQWCGTPIDWSDDG